MTTLKQLSLAGFKSIKDVTIDFHSMNVLIGANGSGKSNFISFFKLLNEMIGERLQEFVARHGRASSLLHYGPKVTPQITASLIFETDTGESTYFARLFHVAQDSLMFAEESLLFRRNSTDYLAKPKSLGAGHQETGIILAADQANPTAKVFRHLLGQCRVYQFHDTSLNAAVRQYCYSGDNRWLMPDAGNLAAVLLRISSGNGGEYARILGTIRQIAPFFGDFVLEPTANQDIALNWREKDSSQVFGPHQLSDGTLRAICLTTLLLQPEADLPNVIIIDEPELGLHPAAQNILADMLQRAADHCQVIVATQSATLLDHFAPDDIIVVDRAGKESSFHRLAETELQEWLEEYTLGELWQKNVLGGGPF